ncbi:MAG: hypothetical protein MHM6MM_004921 [Cercozoa sp. M6MM]
MPQLPPQQRPMQQSAPGPMQLPQQQFPESGIHPSSNPFVSQTHARLQQQIQQNLATRLSLQHLLTQHPTLLQQQLTSLLLQNPSLLQPPQAPEVATSVQATQTSEIFVQTQKPAPPLLVTVDPSFAIPGEGVTPQPALGLGATAQGSERATFAVFPFDDFMDSREKSGPEEVEVCQHSFNYSRCVGPSCHNLLAWKQEYYDRDAAVSPSELVVESSIKVTSGNASDSTEEDKTHTAPSKDEVWLQCPDCHCIFDARRFPVFAYDHARTAMKEEEERTRINRRIGRKRLRLEPPVSHDDESIETTGGTKYYECTHSCCGHTRFTKREIGTLRKILIQTVDPAALVTVSAVAG